MKDTGELTKKELAAYMRKKREEWLKIAYNLPMCHKRICPTGHWIKPCLWMWWDEKYRIHRCKIFAYIMGDAKVHVSNAKYILNHKYPKDAGKIKHGK